jgi:serine/threonine protein kinase
MALSQPYGSATPHISHNRFGPYQINGVLGQGAVAMAYAATSPQGQPRVLKVLMRPAAAQKLVRLGFQHEYRALSRLRHRNIVRAYETGEVDSYLYTSLERIDGETLDDYLLRAKKIGEAPAIGIVRQVASALNYLHEEGYVHRDLKPSNILMARDGRAVLFDFGTVLNLNNPPIEDTIGVYGTPAFLAPEQINNGPVDGRADLYALGIILYRMVAGHKPFYGGRSEVLDAHLNEMPPPPSEYAHVSPDLERVILKSIAKKPDDRYQTGNELIAALENVEPAPEPEKVELGQRIRRLFGAT